MTQRDRVLQYLKDFGSITRYESFIDLGIAELPARICELEAMGYQFDKETVFRTNRYGDQTHYTRYSLKEQEQ